ncbi:metal/formaldehyde-sensitive transcriptional repressor [Aeromonas hydrophila]|uniref:metal/formaldehyde-sensitive transcriptional repressor n=1 Tax=Aeromonas hydrophila TaxID=644 RepID=UPI00207CCF6E|nr:metal/formaldehyde-sensitive transcriptional repressor [Aeromonas hydrophila]MCO4211302.1 metal/formaldehyde-sensitive transcriptional repressor [Aeromonas hydrophila]HDX8442204.1 metal/formaldehyde-sensitive transcriptional repressor [Aeromonas hydrophila]HDX8633266.1 metal/formaldehyde-sensitive transcriptional repressor [Aeromonas hydrophila]
MSHTIHGKKKLLARVRRIKGQAGALESALEQESDCAAILQQIAAIRGAVNGLMLEVLEGHIREHLGAEEATQAERLEDLDQVVRVLRSYLK